MKVIKKAIKQTSKQFTCRCGAVLEVDGKDLRHQGADRDGDAYTFECPECKQDNWVDASLIPQGMREKAR